MELIKIKWTKIKEIKDTISTKVIIQIIRPPTGHRKLER